MQRQSFIFYRSFYEAVSKLPPEQQTEIFPAIIRYALDGIPPDCLSPVSDCVFQLIKPLIDAANRKRDNGMKGGAPVGNKNATRNKRKTTNQQPKNNLGSTEKQAENDLKQPLFNNILLSDSNESSNNNYSIDDEFKNSSSTTKDVDDVDDVAEKFFKKISDVHFIRHARKALSLSASEFIAHAQAVISEWKISSPQSFLDENTPERHLINQIRIKRDCPNENKARQKERVRATAEEEKKQKEEEQQRMKSVPVGNVATKEFLRSKGLNPDGSILQALGIPYTEDDAIREARMLHSSNMSNNYKK